MTTYIKLQEYEQELTADGAITIKNGQVKLSKSSACAATLASPTAGTDDGCQLVILATTAQAHTVTCTAGFGGGTTSRDVATFGGAINDTMTVRASAGVWYLVSSRNVTLG